MYQNSVNSMPCCIKHTSRFDMFRSILSLSKMAHHMCRGHPFSQRNMTTERAVGWVLEVTGNWEGVDKI